MAAGQFLGHEKGKFQRLGRVEPRVARRMIPVRQVLVGQRANAAGTLGHVRSRHLEMHPAGDRPFGIVDSEEFAHLAQHAVEGRVL